MTEQKRDLAIYEVGVKWESERMRIEARNSTEAKRTFCQMTGRKFSDPWHGASILSARRVEA
ncbi:hypothetical protein G3578_07585 [Brevibacillus sp. SYP-B805]|uniref:hypothetical protein n=1 Tax=Brevibacillus sp. SYP-B805 TaxID=1578199 RepID=UPI0013EC3C7F|nr:hypothetical protein [Brevibacillus sp. SYP-B805]NGQ95045.1 hypothetical protein [Brevibacillus sp. SYP-B805]